LKELILGIAAVDDVETTGLESASQLHGFRSVAVCHAGVDGNPSEDIEVDMHLGGAVLVVVPQGPNHLGQGGQQAAVDGRQAPQGLGLAAGNQGDGLASQFAEDVAEQVGSNTRAASLSDPKEVRATPRSFCTLSSMLACWMPRKLVTMGLKK
jgi:hypothetical protein